jgi:integrase
VAQGGRVAPRAIVMQRKTRRPVQFELTEQTREAVQAWITHAKLTGDQFLFPSRLRSSPHLSTRQYAKIVDAWVSTIGLDPNEYGTHTMRRTKATLIYRRTKNLRAVQLLLGHTKLESTVRYLGIEVDDALEIRRADRGLRSNGPPVSPAVTNRPGADLHLCVYLARFQTISSTPAGAFGLMNRISSAVIDVTTRL